MRRRFFWPSGIVIRFVREGCINRPFYHLAVLPAKKRVGRVPDEVIGSFDIFANENNERLFAVDIDRLNYWLGKGAKLSPGTSALLGYAGILEPSPASLLTAWRNRIAKENPEAPEIQQKKRAYTEDMFLRGIIP
ncbi:probable 28S ribosomal protein S16, mitochondrial [Tetranychus urticae]|uniref:Small ribosomal subunit protein bS16m n=1 Tax=Tetranychus urticae TaxID=32264 RepID=T1K1H2_TETUR|nr:probable 28S ribosomal protein S16, mitochondrial [Tetranychus urticae]